MLFQQFWCWIGSRYNAERMAGQYIWMWVNLGVSALVYIILFFWARGNITVNPTYWWKVELHKRSDMQTIDPDGRRRRSLGLIVYASFPPPEVLKLRLTPLF